MASPNKLPTKIKELRGTVRKDRVLENEMQPGLMDSLPAAPKTLKDHGKDLWFHICSELLNLNMLTTVGLPQIESYCKDWQLYKIAEKNVDEKGPVVKLKTGVVAQNPYLKTMNDCRSRMTKFEDRWGLSPSSQAKIPAKPKKSDDDIPEFNI